MIPGQIQLTVTLSKAASLPKDAVAANTADLVALYTLKPPKQAFAAIEDILTILPYFFGLIIANASRHE